MFIDVHTHISESPRAVQSVQANDFINKSFPDKQFFTTGIHPWYVEDETNDIFLKELKERKPNNLIGIGECGLDRVKGPSLNQQKEIFERQLELAREMNLPVIIHQVKTLSDILPFLNQFSDLTYIFHAYNGNEIQTSQLMEYNTYFSFGFALENMTEKMKQSIGIIPVDRLFLETDESEVSIDKLYQILAQQKLITVQELKEAVFVNFKKVFKKNIDELD